MCHAVIQKLISVSDKIMTAGPTEVSIKIEEVCKTIIPEHLRSAGAACLLWTANKKLHLRKHRRVFISR